MRGRIHHSPYVAAHTPRAPYTNTLPKSPDRNSHSAPTPTCARECRPTVILLVAHTPANEGVNCPTVSFAPAHDVNLRTNGYDADFAVTLNQTMRRQHRHEKRTLAIYVGQIVESLRGIFQRWFGQVVARIARHNFNAPILVQQIVGKGANTLHLRHIHFAGLGPAPLRASTAPLVRQSQPHLMPYERLHAAPHQMDGSVVAVAHKQNPSAPSLPFSSRP